MNEHKNEQRPDSDPLGVKNITEHQAPTDTEKVTRLRAFQEEVVAKGFAGCGKNGTLVDRREHPDAVPVAENPHLGIPKPKPWPDPKLETRMKNIIVEIVGVDPEKIKPDSRLDADLGADSLDQMELLMATEEEFGIEIADDKAERCRTFKDFVILVSSLIK